MYIHTHLFSFLFQSSLKSYGGICFIIAEIMEIWHYMLTIFLNFFSVFLTEKHKLPPVKLIRATSVISQAALFLARKLENSDVFYCQLL